MENSYKDLQHDADDSGGAAVPWLYETRWRRWCTLFATVSVCALASGPVAAWPTLEPLLEEEGVFRGARQQASFDAVYSLAMVAMLSSSLPSGLLFDKGGGRFCGVLGAAAAAVGLFLMAMAAWWPAEWDWLLYFAYPLATGGGMLNSYCMYSFIWLLPESASLVTGIAGGIAALSDMAALVAVWLHDVYDLRVSFFFFALAALSVASALACSFLVPSLDFCMACATEMTAGSVAQSPAEESSRSNPCEAVLEKEQRDEEGQQREAKGREANNLDDTWGCRRVVRSWRELRRRPGVTTLVVMFSTVYCLSMLYPTQEMLFYYDALWPPPRTPSPATTTTTAAASAPAPSSETATRLVNLFAVVYGLGGFVCAVAGGYACDKLGIVKFTRAVAACALSTALLLLAGPFPAAQALAQVDLTLGFNLYLIVVTKYSVLYSPPDLFGTMSGVLFTVVSVLMGISAAIVGLVVNAASSSSSPLLQYQGPFLALGVGATVLGLWLAEHWRRHPPPLVGGGPPIEHHHCHLELEEEATFAKGNNLVHSGQGGLELGLGAGEGAGASVGSPGAIAETELTPLCGDGVHAARYAGGGRHGVVLSAARVLKFQSCAERSDDGACLEAPLPKRRAARVVVVHRDDASAAPSSPWVLAWGRTRAAAEKGAVAFRKPPPSARRKSSLGFASMRKQRAVHLDRTVEIRLTDDPFRTYEKMRILNGGFARWEHLPKRYVIVRANGSAAPPLPLYLEFADEDAAGSFVALCDAGIRKSQE